MQGKLVKLLAAVALGITITAPVSTAMAETSLIAGYSNSGRGDHFPAITHYDAIRTTMCLKEFQLKPRCPRLQQCNINGNQHA